MLFPTYLDGCSVVVLRQGVFGFRVVESGILSYDGEDLWLTLSETRRVLSTNELGSLRPVLATSKIPECRGFDFFLLEVSALANEIDQADQSRGNFGGKP